MASGGVPVDADRKEAYYIRLHLLIVKEGTAILKARFDSLVPPNNLHMKLQERKVLNTMNYGKNNNLISRSQYNLLYPPGRPPSSGNFDVSLLVYLLRYICGLKSKSNWWSITDNSKIADTVHDEEADIVRIRNLRNQIEHKQVPSLEQEEFDTMWDLAEQ
ncbi:uncharacterized protein LOC128552055, partial [Mercenaria mercenaria]|uniref:uncharacterized protein LOC128552055 n=1 Tax=Mercenaria mercenaria TaxID=6596 RepID=UPI00234F6665